MNEVVRIGLVLLVALSAVGAGTAAALPTGPGSENAPGLIEEDEMKKISLDICFDIQVIERSQDYFTRLTIIDGGIEAGVYGEERPFYRYIFNTPNEIEDFEVVMSSPSITNAEPTPYLVPQIMGEENEKMHSNWKDGDKVVTAKDWSMILIGNNDDRCEYSLKIYPVEYTRQYARIYTSIELSYTEMNGRSAPVYLPRSGKPIGDIDYLVITHEDLKDAVIPMAEWKTQKGLFTLIYTTEEIDKMYDSGDLASKMRSLVMEMEEEYDLDYLLIAGDWDKVPTRNTYNANPATQYGEPSHFASDNYFACVDKGTTWNKDNDKRYAEPGEIDDAVPDLAVGRLGINDPKVMTDKINELIEREKNPEFNDDMLTAVLMGGDNQNVPGSSVDFMEYQWKTYWDDIFKENESIYFDGSGSLSFGSSSVKKMLDMNTQFLAYFSHGRYEGLPQLYDRDDVSSLEDNGSSGLLFAMACVTGWFDKSTGGMISGSGDCFAEAITEEPDKGLVGYIGASRLAAGACDNVYSGDAPGLQEDYFRAVRMVMNGDLEPTTGAIYREAVKRFSTSFYPFPNNMNDVSERTFLEYNLMGEPDAPLVLEEPERLTLDHTLSANKDSVSANVKYQNGTPVNGAMVTITKLGELGVSGVTDKEGAVTISIPQSNGGNVTITAYMDGDIPDQYEFELPDELDPTGDHLIAPEDPDGNNGYYVTNPTISIFGDEPVTVEYRWNEGEILLPEKEELISAPEGNNTLHYRVKDLSNHYSNWYKFNVSVDTTPPEIRTVLDPIVPDGMNGYYITKPEVLLMSEDQLVDTRYKLDGSIKMDYKGPVTVGDGEHRMDLWARDLAGNQATVNVSLLVDTTLPMSGTLLSHLPDGKNGYYITPPTVELYNDDDEALMEYRWDEGSWNEYSGPLVVPEGYNKLFYRSMDPAGNIEPEQFREFHVDTVVPGLEITLDPAVPTGLDDHYIETPKISALSDGDAVAYVILPLGEEINSGTEWAAFSDILPVPDGEWTLIVRARDEAGNEKLSEPMELKVDTEIPDIFWQISPPEPPTPTGWYRTHPTISVFTTHLDAHTQWKTAGIDEWQFDNGPLELPGGRHDLMIRSIDKAGNVKVETLPEIKVDCDKPWIDILFLENGTIFGPNPVEIRWDGGDETSAPTFEFKLDNEPWIGVGDVSAKVLQGLEDGTHSIAVKITDETGRETASWRTFKVDATAPSVVGITPNGEDHPVNVRVEVKFSEKMDPYSVDLNVKGASGSLQWEGNTLIFIPGSGLEYGTEYEVLVTGADEFGNEMEAYSHSFSTYSIVVEETVEEEPDKEGMNMIPIIIGAAAVSLIFGIGATFLIMRRKKAFTFEE